MDNNVDSLGPVWAVLAPALRAVRAPLVLIDGPSGAGKSTFADNLVAAWPADGTPELIRMDDIYPGWDGLDAASREVAEELVAPRARGRRGRLRGYDWAAAVRLEWRAGPDPDAPLIIEGCGALSRASAPSARVRIWIDAEETFSRHRALERDGDTYRPHWDAWRADFLKFSAEHSPRERANLLLRSDASGLNIVHSTLA